MPIIRRHFRLIIVLGILIVLTLVFEAGRWSVYSAHPELSQTEQAQALLANVGKLIQLPAGETPTMATINDAASAKVAQPFLANAQNGDVLIVYAQAGEAILYRPSTDKLIAVGPVDNTSPSTAANPTVTPAATTDSTSSPQATNAHATTTKK